MIKKTVISSILITGISVSMLNVTANAEAITGSAWGQSATTTFKVRKKTPVYKVSLINYGAKTKIRFNGYLNKGQKVKYSKYYTSVPIDLKNPYKYDKGFYLDGSTTQKGNISSAKYKNKKVRYLNSYLIKSPKYKANNKVIYVIPATYKH